MKHAKRKIWCAGECGYWCEKKGNKRGVLWCKMDYMYKLSCVCNAQYMYGGRPVNMFCNLACLEVVAMEVWSINNKAARFTTMELNHSRVHMLPLYTPTFFPNYLPLVTHFQQEPGDQLQPQCLLFVSVIQICQDNYYLGGIN